MKILDYFTLKRAFEKKFWNFFPIPFLIWVFPFPILSIITVILTNKVWESLQKEAYALYDKEIAYDSEKNISHLETLAGYGSFSCLKCGYSLSLDERIFGKLPCLQTLADYFFPWLLCLS
ncbi:MAG: hypothetical protein D6785_12295 [Planctomycetota bacterium]|nr:MAG: hypothetical protein D6785_12295 [Planctomycetota bacterium]